MTPGRDERRRREQVPVSPGRRTLLNWLLGTSAGALIASIVYPVARFVSPPPTPEATTNQVDGGFTNDPEFFDKGFKILRFGQEPVILIRVAEADFRAFAATCTHLDCIVDFRVDKQLIWCWCHNGVYDLQGTNIGGPPPRPLRSFEVHLMDDQPGGPKKLMVVKS